MRKGGYAHGCDSSNVSVATFLTTWNKSLKINKMELVQTLLKVRSNWTFMALYAISMSLTIIMLSVRLFCNISEFRLILLDHITYYIYKSLNL